MVNPNIIEKIFTHLSDDQILRYLTLSSEIFNIMNVYFINKMQNEHKYIDFSQLEPKLNSTPLSIYKAYIKLTINKKCIMCTNKLCYTKEDKHRVSSGISSPVCSICIEKYILQNTTTKFPKLRSEMGLVKKSVDSFKYTLANYNIKYHAQLNVCIYKNSYLQELLFLKCIVCQKIVTTKISKDTFNSINFYNNLRIACSDINPDYADCIKKYLKESCLLNYCSHLNYKGICFRKKTCIDVSGVIESQHSLIHTCCIGKYDRKTLIMRNHHVKEVKTKQFPGKSTCFYKLKKNLNKIERYIVQITYLTSFPIVLANNTVKNINDYKRLSIFIGGCQSCNTKSGICTCTSKNKNINVFWGRHEDYPNFEIFKQYIQDYSIIPGTIINDHMDEISERIDNEDLMRKFVIYSTQTIFL